VLEDTKGGWWTTPIWRRRGRLCELRWTHASWKTVHSCLGWIHQPADNTFFHCMDWQSVDSPEHTAEDGSIKVEDNPCNNYDALASHTQVLQTTLLHLQKYSSSTSCVHHCWLHVINFECGGFSPTEWPYMWIENWANNNGWIGIELGTTQHYMFVFIIPTKIVCVLFLFFLFAYAFQSYTSQISIHINIIMISIQINLIKHN
jgi:hypothetical protein